MKFTKNLPVYVLSGALIFVGVASASQAQGAWTSSEKKTVSQMQKQIGILNARINTLEAQLGTADGTYVVDTVNYLSDTTCGTGSKVFQRQGSFTLGTAKFYACQFQYNYTSR
jgi:hypothetical protein